MSDAQAEKLAKDTMGWRNFLSSTLTQHGLGQIGTTPVAMGYLEAALDVVRFLKDKEGANNPEQAKMLAQAFMERLLIEFVDMGMARRLNDAEAELALSDVAGAA